MRCSGKIAVVLVFVGACRKEPEAPDQLRACEGGGDPLVTVRVTNVDGEPFAPDFVMYIIDADGPYDREVDDFTDHEAEFANDACTRRPDTAIKTRGSAKARAPGHQPSQSNAGVASCSRMSCAGRNIASATRAASRLSCRSAIQVSVEPPPITA